MKLTLTQHKAAPIFWTQVISPTGCLPARNTAGLSNETGIANPGNYILPCEPAAGDAGSGPSAGEELSVLWHELLTPLAVIKGYLSTLLEFDESISPEERRRYLLGADAASDRVIKMLDDLRDVTHLEKAQPLGRQCFCMSELVQSVISDTTFQTGHQAITLLPHKRLPLASGDPDRLRQVLENLIGNAIKYSRHQEPITVGINLIKSEKERRSRYGDTPPLRLPSMVVTVSDDSIGIPQNDLENIFKRFYRVKNKLTGTVPGTGLGLYICKLIMESHGGAIWARNKYHQKGSIFHFSLPL